MTIEDEFNYNQKSISTKEENSKFYFNLTTSGNWSGLNEYNNSVIFTAHHDLVDLDFHTNEKLTVIKEPAYIHNPVNWVQELYQPVNYTDKSLVSFIKIVDQTNLYSCEYNMRQLLNCRYNNDCYSFDNNIIDYFIDGKCTTIDTLNETLKNIMENTDKVLIEVDKDGIEIDLSNLPFQCVVQINSLQSSSSSKTLNNNKKPKKKYIKEDDLLIWKTVNLYGNIKDKVSYLTISNTALQIYGSPLNIHTLRFISSKCTYYTEKIETNDLIVDFDSHVFLYNNEVFNVAQYGIIIPYDDDEESDYRLSIEQNYVSFYYKTKDEEEYNKISEYYGNIPKRFAQTLCVIAVSHSFDFYINDNFESGIFNNINITILNEEGLNLNYANWVPENLYKYQVKFNVSSNNWKPEYNCNVTFTSFQDLVCLNSTSKYLTITNESIYSFKPHELILPTQTPAPYPTNIPSQTPIPEIVEDLFDETKDEITSLDEINNALTEKYENMKDVNGNKVVIVNANSFPFQFELKEDQYIKSISNSNINFINGNLNLILPDEGKVTVKLNDSKNVNLSLKGKGNIELTQEKVENEINIKNNANINGSFSLTVPNTVEKVSIESVILSKESEIICNKDLIINDLKAESQTDAKLKSVIISKSLIIPQSAKIEFKDVNVKDSNIIYNMVNFYELNPILYGEFKDPPKNIVINCKQSTENIDSLSFNLIEGTFGDGICKHWADSVEFSVENKYKYIDCYDMNNGLLLDKKQKLMIELLNNEKKNDSGGKNNGLPPAAIAGIVVGVIVAIAVVIVIVIIVIKKKKGNNESSGSIKEDDEKQNNDDL